MARLTEAELEEGRRILDGYLNAEFGTREHGSCATKMLEFWIRHADALLARPEEIAREAVREFAETVCKSQPCAPGFQGTVRALAAARGATLEEKP